MKIVRVLRPDSEVFSRDAVQSFSHVPVTVGHPSEMVDADNWRSLAVGEASDEVLRDGERMRIPLVLKDRAAIEIVNAGTRELSAGYTCTLDFSGGVTPEGEAYDAVQKNIRANHIAIVHRGRAGSEFRIGDASPNTWGVAPITINDGDETMSTPALKTVVVGDAAVETTVMGAQAIEALKTKLAEVRAEHQATKDAAATDKAVLETDIQTKDGEIKGLTKKLEDTAAVETKARALLATVDQARTVIGDGYEWAGKSEATIATEVAAAKRQALVDAHGAEWVGTMSDAEVTGAYRMLSKDTATDPVAKAIRDGKTTTTVTDKGQSAYEASLANAWKTPTAGVN